MSPETTETTRVEPVRKSITVEASVEHAFEVFTERMGEWWPVKTHSVHEELADEASLEPRLSGAIFELWRDGRENWGEITAWEPPSPPRLHLASRAPPGGDHRGRGALHRRR
jgi:hypothetical protein